MQVTRRRLNMLPALQSHGIGGNSRQAGNMALALLREIEIASSANIMLYICRSCARFLSSGDKNIFSIFLQHGIGIDIHKMHRCISRPCRRGRACARPALVVSIT